METGRNGTFESLLNKYLEGRSTITDKQHFYDLVSVSENEKIFKEILLKHISEYNEDPTDYPLTDFDRIYENILYEIKQNDIQEAERQEYNRRTKVKRLIQSVSALVAIFILAFFLGRLFPVSVKSIIPEPAKELSYNEIKAPYGSKSEIKLPDGTVVLLNAGSTLKYRSDFNSGNRYLTLTGEAYFKVARNNEIPLFVNAGKINVKAVGTEFNIKAYDDEGTIETTLVAGKVEITQQGQHENQDQIIDLIPNQKAIYLKEAGNFTLERIKDADSLMTVPVKTTGNNIVISPKVDVDQVVAWTYGKLIIHGENLENLCIELQRKYDVRIIFSDDEIKKYRFTGVLLDETLEQVLNVIKLTAPIDYILEGKTVFMSSDKENVNKFSKHLK